MSSISEKPRNPVSGSEANRKTIFISTGEVSGDLQGALIVEALKRQAVADGLELEIVALGGERMAKAGATLLADTTAIGSIGILESLPFLLPTLQIQRRAKQYLQQHPPDLVVLIDYLGPNLGIGSYLQQYFPQIPIVYYIAPQEWVWSLNSRKTDLIIKMTRRLLAIFPEEARYFKERGASVSWVGHPLVDRMLEFPSRETSRAALGIKPEETAIALIPASRIQELKYLLPTIFQAACQLQTQLPHVHFWIPLSLELYRHKIAAAIKYYNINATIISDRTQLVLAAADLAIAKSGTVNLELALLNVPQVVLYRINPITVWIARRFLKFSIPFMSPPNLVLMKSIVPELLQEQATPDNIVKEALALLFNPERHQQLLTDYQEMRSCLGEVGVCDRAAIEILQMLN